MPARDMSVKEIKEEVLYRLFRRGSWGHSYSSRQKIEKWISSQVKNNGKNVSKVIDELIQDLIILPYKKGETISLNPRRKKEIMDIISKEFQT